MVIKSAIKYAVKTIFDTAVVTTFMVIGVVGLTEVTEYIDDKKDAKEKIKIEETSEE